MKRTIIFFVISFTISIKKTFFFFFEQQLIIFYRRKKLNLSFSMILDVFQISFNGNSNSSNEGEHEEYDRSA